MNNCKFIPFVLYEAIDFMRLKAYNSNEFFTLGLHKKEIGEGIFQEVLELLIELIAQGIVKKEKL